MQKSFRRVSRRPAFGRGINLRKLRRVVAQLLAFVLFVQTVAPPAIASPSVPPSVVSIAAAMPWLVADLGDKVGWLFGSGAAAAPPAEPRVVAAAQSFSIELKALGTSYQGHTGIDYHAPTRKVIVSANGPTGQPNNFQLIQADGAHQDFSNVAGLGGVLRIATARDEGQGSSLGGFRLGELFVGTGTPGVIARVSPDGASVQNPWVTLPGESGGVQGLYLDRAGVFGGDLIAVTSGGGVWRVNSSAAATRVAGLDTPLSGVTTLPDEATKYGPWAGRILVGAKAQGALYAVDAQGTASVHRLGVSPEDVRLVPAHENFYALDPAGQKILGAPADTFAGFIGDVLVAQESPGVLLRLHWNGVDFEAGQIAQTTQLTQAAFAPAGLAEVPGVRQFYDKIAVVRHSPSLNSGRVEGALWQLLAENVTLDGTDVITSDLLVPGTPRVVVGGGHTDFGGVVEGSESRQPTSHQVSISGNASLRRLITRTNPIELSAVAPPPAPSGTRDVSLTKPGGAGDFAALRDLSLSGQAGAVAVPPGTYGRFAATGHTTLVLGVENSPEPTVYNLEELSLAGGSELRLAGPVVLTVRKNVTLTGSTVGAADSPRRLLLKVAAGDVNVNGKGVLYGIVRDPNGIVTIGGGGRIRGTVTCDLLNVSGNGVLQITETDIAPPPVNRPPVVDAGADQTITLPADTLGLNGVATDDGLPAGAPLSINWTKVSGPGPVSFGDSSQPVTAASFTEPGTYVLKLTASDSRLVSSDTVTVTVVPRNQPPVVEAGPEQAIELPDGANLSGVVTDDALPRGSVVTATWSQLAGPGAVTFADAHAAATAATFSAPGVYTLQLSADDTEFTARDTLVVTVYPVNQPPVADAGADQTVRLPAGAGLHGAASDDGFPVGSALTTTWSLVGGPGAVVFADASAPVTTATFSTSGTYTLRLTASDTRLTASDEVTVNVLPSNLPPSADAGPDQTVDLSAQTLPLENLTLRRISTGFNSPIGIDYHQPTGKVVMSVNYPSGQPHNFELVAADGSRTGFSGIHGLTEELKLATARDEGNGMSRGGFRAGELFAGTGTPGVIARVSPDGASVQNPWVTLPGESGLMRGSLYVDRTGVFGGDLIAVTTGGGVWRVNSAGRASRVAQLNTHLEGLSTIPNIAEKYGPWAGKILIGAEEQGRLYAVDADGVSTSYQLGINPEDIDIIPPNENFFGVDYAGQTLWGAPAAAFGSIVGDILVAQESPGILYRVRWNGTAFEKSQLAQVSQWEHVTFAPAGIAEIPSVGGTVTLNGVVTDDGLPAGAPLRANWTKVSGPGPVSFADASRPVTTASFLEPGAYVLRLTADDSEFTAADEMTVTVNAPNQPPVVNAGPDQIMTQPDAAVLNGVVTDDGRPAAGALTYAWGVVIGPGAVTFSDPALPVTTARFSAPGTYVLRLSASDSVLSGADEVTVVANPAVVPLEGATLALSPSAAGPNVTGTSQTLRAALKDVNNVPLANQTIQFIVSGTNTTSGNSVTDASGVAAFTYTGATTGGDTVRATVRSGLTLLESNEATVSWVTPVQVISTTTVNARFFTSNHSGVFGTPPTQEPAFSQFFPTINFNPPNGTVPGNTSGVGVNTRPFTNVTTDVNGNFTGVIPAQGNGLTAGVDVLFDFNAVFTGTFTVARAGNITFNFFSDDGFIFGVGGGATRVGGALSNPPASGRTPFEDLPVMGSFNNPTGPVANSITVFFPAAGSYPYEVDYSECCAGELALTMTTAGSGNHGVPPTGSLALSPNTVAPRDVGQQQTFNVKATDAAGNPIASLPLLLNIAGANLQQLSATTDADGRAAFTYTGSNVGTDGLQVSAPVGGSIAYSNVVSVRWNVANRAPVVNAGADQSITPPSSSVTLSGTVTDDGLPSGAPLTTVWTKVSGPGAVTFGNAGQRATTATFGQPGVYVLRLTASDTLLTGSDDVTVSLDGPNQSPVVNAGPDLTVTLPAGATLVATATDDGLPLNSTLSVSWAMLSGPGNVTFNPANQAAAVATFSAPGTYVLQLTANDTAQSTSDSVSITVNPAVPPPTATIASPADGAEVTGRTAFVGTISQGTTWRLEYSPAAERGTPNQVWTVIGSGNTPVTNGVLGVFDPTLLLNGLYLVRLVATDAAGQTTVNTVTAVATGEQKVGNFSLGFNDLSVPVAGLPIEVRRTYDSRDKRGGDFGVGWRLDLQNVRIDKNMDVGKDWEQTLTGGFFPFFCLRPRKPHIVSATFPSGKVYSFEAVSATGCSVLFPIQFASVAFQPQPGTLGSLEALDGTEVIWSGPLPGVGELLNDDFVPYNPTQFRLTTEDGSVYVIDQSGGVRSLTDSNGNTLTVTPNGVVHSSGKSLTFVRDGQNRITQIVDPAGNSLVYGYDSRGDLVSVRDREGNTTTFTYNSGHGLLTVKDPRGVQPVRNEYDAAGRLVKHIDAFGKEVVYSNDLNARQQVVTDRLGKVTVHEYDARGNVVKTTDPDGRVTLRTYDARDNQLSETRPDGKTSVYTYDAQDNKTSETDPLGNVTRFTYNSRKQVTSITDARGGVTLTTYDAGGNVVSVKDSLGNTTSFTYNGSGQRTSVTDPLGNVTRYDFDAAGNLYRETDPKGHVTTYTTDANGNRLSQTTTRTNGAGAVETLVAAYQYDRQNQLTKVTYADGTSRSTAYNPIGKVSAVTDQLGRQTRHDYDAMARLIRTTHPDLTTEEFGYDAEGRRTRSVDRAGRATLYEYDAEGRLLKTTYPDATFTANTYDSIGRVIAVRDERGNVTSYEYDPNCGCSGRRAKVTDALGKVTTFTYDANANRTSMTDARGNTTRYEYDAKNRRVRIVYPDESFESAAYDALDRLISKTDQAGKTTRFEYDSLGLPTKVTDALEQVTRYGYDEAGYRVSQTDARNNTTAFDFDKVGRQVKRTLPLGMSETRAYDAVGNLTATTDFNGKTTTLAYDALNRLKTKTPDASLGQPAVGFTYTPTGKRATMSDATGTTTYVYDARDRLTSKSTPQGTLNYTYDAAGNLTGITSANAGGASVTYAYDVLNRLSTVNDLRAGGAATYAYDAAGNLDSYAAPNGVTSNYTYNTLNRLTDLTLAKGGTLAGYAYTLGPTGNRLSVAEAGGRTASYAYDDVYRLTGETVAGAGAANGSVTYTYDAVGNRLTRDSSLPALPSAGFGYDANDRLTTETYDNNGNTKNSGGTSYAYDFENRLASVGGGALTFAYDGDGNRVAKTAGGVTTKYLVDDRNPTGYAQVLEESVGGGVRRVYAYGHNIVSQYQQLNGTWAASYYGLDGHGNVRLLTDAAGAVTDTYDYDAFGNLIASTGNTPNVYLYTGEQFDPNIGFYYLRARYYDGNVGRFTTMDTYAGCVFDPASLHKYLYTGNDPVNKTDPSGLMTLTETGTTINLITVVNVMVLSALGLCIARLLLSTALIMAGVDTTTIAGPCVARSRPCPPCPAPPPPEIDRVPPSRPHFPCPGDHWHYYEYNQNPITCVCYGPKRLFGGCCGAGAAGAPC